MENLFASYLDNVSSICKLAPAVDTIWRLCKDCDGVFSIELATCKIKFGIYSGNTGLVAADAVKLRITHQLDGFSAVCTPVVSAESVS